MRDFLGISSLYRKFRRAKVNADPSSMELQSIKIESKNYTVCYDPSPQSVSSAWMNIKNRRKHAVQSNRIRTTRYNVLTFLPKNIFEQFHRIANIYFAILIGLNWVPVINAISKTVTRRKHVLMNLFTRILLAFRLPLYH